MRKVRAAASSRQARARAAHRTARSSAEEQAEPVETQRSGIARHQLGRGRAGERQVQIAGDARVQAAVHARCPGSPRAAAASSRSRSPAMRARFRPPSPPGQPAGLAEPDDQRRRQGAGAQPALLPAAGEQRRQPHPRPAADVQRADALRAVELVAADRGQVDLPCRQVERDLAGRLRGIGVEQRAGLLGDGGQRRRCPGSRRSRCSPP